MLDTAAQKGAEAALARMGGHSPMNLDNSTAQLHDTPLMEGETSMAFRRVRVKIGTDLDSKPKYKWVQGKTQDELNENIAKAMSISYSAPQINRPPEKTFNLITFREYTEKWYGLYCVNKTKLTTQAGYRSYLKNHLYPVFGDLPISHITTDIVQAFLNERKDMARKTLKSIKVFLSMILDAAVDDNLLAKNPASNKRIVIPSVKEERRDALKQSDMRDIIANIDCLDEQDRLLTSLLLFTGMRRGEVLGLKWEDIDWASGFIHVQRNATYPGTNQAVVTTPKSEKGKRLIPILPQLKKHFISIKKEGFIIGGMDKPISLQQYNNTYSRISKTIKLHGATAHIFRHTFLTEASNAGCEAKMIQAVGGHADVNFTLTHYVHAQPEQLLQAGQKIGAQMDIL